MPHTEQAITVFLNAKILTLDPLKPHGEAMAVQGERILAVGDVLDAQEGCPTDSIKVEE